MPDEERYPGLDEEWFIEFEESKYGEGIYLNEYDGIVSLANAQRNKEGKIWFRMCFAIARNKKPASKSMPWKINLGPPETAFRRLMEAASMIREKYGLAGFQQGDPIPRPSEPVEPNFMREEPPF